MRSLLHLSSKSLPESVSKIDLSAQQGRRSKTLAAQDGGGRFLHFTREVCPSAPVEIPPFVEASSLRVIRRAKGAEGVDPLRENGNEADPRGPGAGFELNGKGDEIASKPKPVIVVIHPRAVFRDCFVRCLEASYDDHYVYSFASVTDWRASTEPLASAPAVAIVVIEYADASTLADLLRLDGTTAKTSIIIVSDIDDVDHIVQTLKLGARGYIPSNLPFNIAVEAVRLVEAGGVFVPASSFVDREHPPAPVKPGVMLTERQMAVLEEIRHGKANKQIAYELNMSEHTVKVHLRHIMRKLKARNRTEVAILSESLLSPDKS